MVIFVSTSVLSASIQKSYDLDIKRCGYSVAMKRWLIAIRHYLFVGLIDIIFLKFSENNLSEILLRRNAIDIITNIEIE